MNRITIILTFISLFSALLLIPSGIYAQADWYVDDDAPGDPGPGDPSISDPLEDGSAAHPFDAIQEGIDAASNNDTVQVADGTYTGAGNKELDFAGKALTLTSENGPNSCIIDLELSGTGFYFHSGETGTSLVDGFRIINGAGHEFAGDYYGGGIYCHSSSPTINVCKIEDCDVSEKGGGIYCNQSSPVITDCLIHDNYADREGGGIYAYLGSPVISDSRFSSNDGHSGGGLYLDQCDTQLTGCNIRNNQTGFGNQGGGIYCEGGALEVNNCLIDENGPNSGGMFCALVSPQIRHTRFAGNSKSAINVRSTGTDPIRIFNCEILNNSAAEGGGLDIGASETPVSIEIRNCVIADNQAHGLDGDGGGIYYRHGSQGLNLHLSNCTIANNTADSQGGGIYFYNLSWPDQVHIENTIFWDNEADRGRDLYLRYPFNEYLTIRYSNLELEPDTLFCGPGMINADPLLADPDGPDDDPGTWEDNNYRLLSGSPCVDAGDPDFVPKPDETDIEGDERLQLCRVDMGADETAYYSDCNANGTHDACDIRDGTSLDCNLNGVPDGCDIAQGAGTDCNGNQHLDACDIDSFASRDCNENGLPDECEVGIQLPDVMSGVENGPGFEGQIQPVPRCAPTDQDLNGNCVLDECEDTASLDFTTWHVDDDAPADPGPGEPAVSDPLEDGSPGHPFDAVQEAINAASHGDTVLLSDGQYTGDGNRDIDYLGKTIVVKSKHGPHGCIINCLANASDPHQGFHFRSGEGPGSVLEGLTIAKAHASSDYGGAINCEALSHPTIINCRLVDNYAYYGGGLCVRSGCNPEIIGCTFNDNYAGWGGGLCIWGGAPVVKDCEFVSNHTEESGGGISCFSGSISMSNCLLRYNRSYHGGGAYISQSYATISSCTFFDNTALGDQETDGIGAGLCAYALIDTTIVDSIFWDNWANLGDEIGMMVPGGGPSTLTISYSDMEGGQPGVYVGSGCTLSWGAGMIDADPLFVSGPEGDNYLSQIAAGQAADSPCVDTGNPASVMIDGTTRTDEVQDAGIIDIGYHYPLSVP